jgi:hypothetical protein
MANFLPDKRVVNASGSTGFGFPSVEGSLVSLIVWSKSTSVQRGVSCARSTHKQCNWCDMKVGAARLSLHGDVGFQQTTTQVYGLRFQNFFSEWSERPSVKGEGWQTATFRRIPAVSGHTVCDCGCAS